MFRHGPDALDDFKSWHTQFTLINQDADLAHDAFDSVASSIGRTHYNAGFDAAEIATATRRIDEGLDASLRTLNPKYRNNLDNYIGPDKPFRTAEEFEALRFMKGDALTLDQKAAINQIRLEIPPIQDTETVAKVLSYDQAMAQLNGGTETLRGFFARKADIEDATTTSALIDRVRIDYPTQYGRPAFFPNDAHVVLETPGEAVSASSKIPRSGDYYVGGGADVRIDQPYPYNGNGFTASRDGHLVPEWVSDEVQLPADGRTIMRFKDANGGDIDVTNPATGQSASAWKLSPDPASTTGFKWEPL